MAPVRKCKACNNPIKGHEGPFGVGKCQMVNLTKDEKDNIGEENKLDELGEEISKLDISESVENVSNADNLPSSPEKTSLEKQENSDNSMESANSPDVAKESKEELPSPTEESDRDTSVTQTADEDSAAYNSDATEEETCLEKSIQTSEVSEDEIIPTDVDNEEAPATDADEKPHEMVTSGYSASKFHSGSQERLKKCMMDDDIRNYLMDNIFQLCRCRYLEEEEDIVDICDCGDAFIDFSEELSAEVTGVYFDPFDMDPDYENEDEDDDFDLRPSLRLAKNGWTKKRPNELRLMFSKIENEGIDSIEGEVHLVGKRPAKQPARRMPIPWEITVTFQPLKLNVNETYTSRGFKEQLRYKEIKFDLLKRM